MAHKPLVYHQIQRASSDILEQMIQIINNRTKRPFDGKKLRMATEELERRKQL
tara:strand:+ start:408 stop:566 length:159 start_codon:yes stop_codon:yes gene_type:complete